MQPGGGRSSDGATGEDREAAAIDRLERDLRAAREELAATTRELSALNAELIDVNAQLRQKISEVEQANDDLRNFFASTKLATLFFDTELRVARYTPAAAELLDLSPLDLGQPLASVHRPLLENGLAHEVEAVLSSLIPSTSEQRTSAGQWYVRRVLPYRTAHRRIEGVVVSFTDVTEARLYAERLAVSQMRQAVVARLGLEALETRDIDAFLGLAVREVQKTLDVDVAEVLEVELELESFLLRAGSGLPPGEVGARSIGAGLDTLAGYALSTRAPVFVDDVEGERRFDLDELHRDLDLRAGLACTIKDADLPYGVLAVFSREPRAFSSDDGAFLAGVAAVIAGAVSRLQTRQRLEIESAVSSLLKEATSLSELAAAVHRAFEQVLGTSFGELWVPGGDDQLRCALTTAGKVSVLDKDVLARFTSSSLPVGSSLVGRVFESQRAACFSPKHRDRFLRTDDAEALGFETALAFPVLGPHGKPVGVITAFHHSHLLCDAALLRCLNNLGRAAGEVLRRVEAERAKQRSEARKVAILDASRDAIVTVDEDRRVVELNAAAEALFGYCHQELVGRDVADLVGNPEARDDLCAILAPHLGSEERALAALGGEGVEMEVATRTGQRVPVEVVLTRFGHGGDTLYTAVLRDITTRKETERALVLSEERFRSLFEKASVALIEQELTPLARLVETLRKSGVDDFRAYRQLHPEIVTRALRLTRVVDVNEETLRLYDATDKSDFLDSLTPMITADAEEILVDVLQALADHTPDVKLDVRLHTLKGRPFDASVCIRITRDNEHQVRALVSVTDLTAYRTALTELERSRRWLSRLNEATPDVVVVYDVDRDEIVYVNRDQTGAPGDRLIGPGDDLRRHQGRILETFIPPDDLEATRRFFQDIKPGRVYEHIHRLTATDGRSSWMQTRAVSFPDDEEGGATQVLVVSRDISELKSAEAELQEANRQKDEFLAMLGHELRNPLTALRSATDLLRLKHPHDPALQDVSGILARQVGHMTKLIDGLLDVSRIVRGKITLEKERLDLAALLHEVVRDQGDVVAHKQLDVRLDLQDGPLAVDGDRVRLAQVFTNILSNAAKFSEPGGAVTLTAVRRNGRAVVTVRDQGVGIAPDALPHIFEPFRQAGQSYDKKDGGLGLGLALVKGLIELHQGEVAAKSEGLGRGAEITVELPLAPLRVEDDVSDSATPKTHDRHRVLVVEDNPDAAAVIRQVIHVLGHDAEVAFDGEQGVKTADAFHPDVVLCDLGLPGGMTGLDVARALRENPEHRGAFLVAVTGYGRPEDKREALDAGFDTHLTKPVEIEAIEQVLATASSRAAHVG